MAGSRWSSLGRRSRRWSRGDGWLQRVADAILGRVPGKLGRCDTATRMMRDADFTTHDVRPAERNRYNARPEIDPMVELQRIVSADDSASSDIPRSVSRVAGGPRAIRSFWKEDWPRLTSTRR